MEFHLAFFSSGGVTNTLPPELRKKEKEMLQCFHYYMKFVAYCLNGFAQTPQKAENNNLLLFILILYNILLEKSS